MEKIIIASLSAFCLTSAGFANAPNGIATLETNNGNIANDNVWAVEGGYTPVGVTHNDAFLFDYVIDNKIGQTTKDRTTSFVSKANSLTVRNQGKLQIQSDSNGSLEKAVTLPGLVIENSTLSITGVWNCNYTFKTPVTFTETSTLVREGGNSTFNAYFEESAPIHGSGLLYLRRENAGTGATFRFNSSQSTYNGRVILSYVNRSGQNTDFQLHKPLGSGVSYLVEEGGNSPWRFTIYPGALDGASRLIVDRSSATLVFSGNTDVPTVEGTAGTFSGSGNLTITQLEDTVLDSAITGSIGIVKKGEATLTLGGNNTFSGGVTLDEGKLLITSANGLGTGTLTLNGGEIDVGTARPGGLIVNAPVPVQVMLTPADFASGVVFRNVTLAQPSDLQVTAVDSAGVEHAIVLDGTDLKLVQTTRTLIWNGLQAGSTWDYTSVNWLTEGDYQSVAFSPGDSAVFTAEVTDPVIVDDAIAAGEIWISGGSYTFSGEGSLYALRVEQEQDATFTVPLQTAEISVAEGVVFSADSLIQADGAKFEARYLKLLFTGTTAVNNVAVAELMLFDEMERVPWPEGSTVTISPDSTASTNANELPRSLIDGYYGKETTNTPWGGRYDYNKFWITNASEARLNAGLVYATVTMPEAVTFNGYNLCGADTRHPTGWKLFASMDGESWVLVDTKKGQTFVKNAWLGDTAAASKDVVPDGRVLPGTILLSGAGSAEIGSLTGSLTKTSSGALTLSGDNSTSTTWLSVDVGTVDLGTHATTPRRLHISENAIASLDFRGKPTLTQLDGTGLLNITVNAEDVMDIAGDFSGIIRFLPGTSGSNTKPRMDGSTVALSANAWFEVADGVQFWSNKANALNLRIAGEAGGANSEAYGGALRIQNGAFNGKLEVLADATVTGRTANGMTVQPAQGSQSPTLTLGVAAKTHTSVDGSMTLTGLFSGLEDSPLNLLVNANTMTFSGGTGDYMGSFTVRGRTDATSANGAVPQSAAAVFTGDKTYAFASVTVGGTENRTETLTVGANATLAVSGDISILDANSTLTVANGGTLEYAGGTGDGVLVLEAGATLRPKAFKNPLAAGSIMLPAEGTLALDIDESDLPSGSWRKAYILKGITQGFSAERFTGVPEGWFLKTDDVDIFLAKDAGVMIILY